MNVCVIEFVAIPPPYSTARLNIASFLVGIEVLGNLLDRPLVQKVRTGTGQYGAWIVYHFLHNSYRYDFLSKLACWVYEYVKVEVRTGKPTGSQLHNGSVVNSFGTSCDFCYVLLAPELCV